MNTSVKMIVVLTVISTLVGGLLSMWDGYTAPMIEAHRLRELQAAIGEVLPAHDRYEEAKAGDLTLYIAKKEGQSEPVGIAFRAYGSGFQGKISIMVGLDPAMEKLTGIKVLEQIETPGLGTKIVVDSSNKTDPHWFPKQFQGVEVKHEIRVIKNAKPTNKEEIQAISGATITSKAVVRIINETIQRAKKNYQRGS